MANFTGGDGNEIFNGGVEADTILGNGGNDTLTGGGAGDVIAGGSGADTISGQDGDDQLYSGDVSPPWNRPYFGNPWSAPVLDQGTEVDTLDGGAGTDTIYAGYGDTVDGGTGSNVLLISFVGAAAGVTADFRQLYLGGSMVVGGATISNIEYIEWIEGSNFADTITCADTSSNFAPIFGMGGNDTLIGGYYTGNMYGGDGDDTLDRASSPYGFEMYGDAGNDTLLGGYNGEYMFGGAGVDVLRGRGGFDSFDGGDGNDLMEGDSYGETFFGGGGNDVVYAAGGGDLIDGSAGNDTIEADSYQNPATLVSGGSDTVFGGDGADVIHAGEYDDLIWSGRRDSEAPMSGKDDITREHDQIFAGDGNDTISAGIGDDVDGGAGSDTLRLNFGGGRIVDGVVIESVQVNTAGFGSGTWTIYGGQISNVESLSLVGGNAGDTFTIATHSSGITIEGGGGNDTVTSANSSVTLTGGSGDDLLISGAAGDIFDGGEGTDTVDYRNAASGVTVTLALAAGGVGTGGGGDQLSNIEKVVGSAHADTINGSDQADTLDGAAEADTLRGYGGNDTLVGGLGSDSMEGGLGDDLFHVDNAGDLVLEAAGQGEDTLIASVNYTLAAGQHVELLKVTPNSSPLELTGNELANQLFGNNGQNVLRGGGGDDRLDGGLGNDTLFGGDGADTLIGNFGNDTMAGGTGDDQYYVDSSGDVVSENAGQGTDRILTSLNYTLAVGLSIEWLTTANSALVSAINLTGNEIANVIYGNAGANVLNGAGGNDTLNGFDGNDTLIGGLGADSMAGGLGNDVFYVDNAGDAVIEGAAEGAADRIFASVSYTLGAGASVELLTTDNNAGTGAINLTGNALAQTIYGNAGANVLNGAGGADTLVGLGGDDRYYVDSAGDVVSEAAGGGNDRIFASVSYTLGVGVSVEQLTTSDNNATTALNLNGNELANLIYGNAGANVLDGKAGDDTLVGLAGNDTLVGGLGNDTLSGGLGDDLYYVDSAGDVVLEAAGEGSADRVLTSVSYALNPSASIELLTTSNNAGTTAINLTGNAQANTIYGNAGNNVLDGRGGADVLVGFGGDDSYYVDNAGDVVSEAAGGGNDRVYASASYALGAGAEVERLTTSNNAGTTAIDLTGNAIANLIYGNAGANVLDGKGGNDTLVGLEGQDTFAFTTALGVGNVDTVSGFSVADDTIRLDNAVFTGLADGALAAGAFATGSAATEADDRVIYNSATGALLFDADGNGAGAAVQFATLAGGLALTSADFLVA